MPNLKNGAMIQIISDWESEKLGSSHFSTIAKHTTLGKLLKLYILIFLFLNEWAGLGSSIWKILSPVGHRLV